jgi:dihydropteroate synthase
MALFADGGAALRAIAVARESQATPGVLVGRDRRLVLTGPDEIPDGRHHERDRHQADRPVPDILDVGGVPARPGPEVTQAEGIRRVVPFVEAVRAAYPDLVISVDTWRHEPAQAACEAGADLLNDTWGGWDPRLAEVAAEFGAGLVCSHVGTLTPRTRPFRPSYTDVTADVLDRVLALAERAVKAGVDPAQIVIDPAHDFDKNTWHSLEITRRLGELTATGWPVLLSASHKDFVGETLGAGIGDRLAGTLAVTAVGAWLGARIFRAHDVRETRQTLDMVAAIRGDLTPVRLVRGLV